jgi:hypothetical protein
MKVGGQGGPETAVLERLKLDLPCDLVVALKVFRPIALRRCKKPARWAARNHCCGEVMLSCPKHRDAFAKCERCKLVRSLRRWTRI